jgi:hypothetical protein
MAGPFDWQKPISKQLDIGRLRLIAAPRSRLIKTPDWISKNRSEAE